MWKLAYPARSWQERALAVWQESKQGVVEVVTGGGKTVFAFLCMSFIRERRDDVRFIILVPSLALLDQWVIALQDELAVDPSEIGKLGGGEKPRPEHRVVVAVLNSARKFCEQLSSEAPTFLIVDECHRAASPQNALALRGSYEYKLGLSATPERDYDENFEQIIVPVLGAVIFKYTYIEASGDGVITPFDLVNIEVPMMSSEQEQHDSLTAKIGKIMRVLSRDPLAESSLKRFLMKRAAVISTVSSRVPAAVRLIDLHRSERAVVFHERVADAFKIFTLLQGRKHNAVLYHAGIDPVIRRESLRQFRRGFYDVLVCCRALDEGMNVPETSIAVIASSTSSERQRIQRLGRILRPSAGKSHATVYTLFATQSERERLMAEAQKFSEIAKVRWQRMKVRSDGPTAL